MRSKTRFLLLLPALALAFAVIPVSGAGAGIQAQVTGMEPLDQKRIHALYNDGDFDAVVSALEAFVRRSGGYPRADSVFVAKHLAVVYSANPATREKGKYYMYQLLELLPSAKLVDMYVSDEIDRIFEKVLDGSLCCSDLYFAVEVVVAREIKLKRLYRVLGILEGFFAHGADYW